MLQKSRKLAHHPRATKETEGDGDDEDEEDDEEGETGWKRKRAKSKKDSLSLPKRESKPRIASIRWAAAPAQRWSTHPNNTFLQLVFALQSASDILARLTTAPVTACLCS